MTDATAMTGPRGPKPKKAFSSTNIIIYGTLLVVCMYYLLPLYVMIVTSLKGMNRMAELAEGARYPAKLVRALQRAEGDPDAVEKVGIHYAAQQCAELLDAGVAGIHFYTLNKSKVTMEIYSNLGLSRS